MLRWMNQVHVGHVGIRNLRCEATARGNRITQRRDTKRISFKLLPGAQHSQHRALPRNSQTRLHQHAIDLQGHMMRVNHCLMRAERTKAAHTSPTDEREISRHALKLEYKDTGGKACSLLETTASCTQAVISP